MQIVRGHAPKGACPLFDFVRSKFLSQVLLLLQTQVLLCIIKIRNMAFCEPVGQIKSHSTCPGGKEALNSCQLRLVFVLCYQMPQNLILKGSAALSFLSGCILIHQFMRKWCKNWCSNKNWCSVWCRKSLILQYSSL